MASSLRRSTLALGLVLTLTSSPAWACGPFLFDNADLDRFSLLEPTILNAADWQPFLDYGSPAFGHVHSPRDGVVQYVLVGDRLPLTTPEDVSNLLYDYEPGFDPLSVAANEDWWVEYFRTVRHRAVALAELSALLYERARPSWLVAADRRYLDALSQDPTDLDVLARAPSQARNPQLPEGLRQRWAFWWIRALALEQDPDTLEVFREFSPGPATTLPLARAQGWAASALVDIDPNQAVELWVDLLVRWPELRAQSFASLASLPPSAWEGRPDPATLVARFFVEGRDFSPETLAAVAGAERVAGGGGAWTETVLFSMAQQIEAESGVFALFGLVDPHAAPPTGLFTDLIDEAEALVDEGTVDATRTWWQIAAYLCLFDGDAHRAASLLARAEALPARSEAQRAQGELISALVLMAHERERDWSNSLQTRLVRALDWAKTRNVAGSNRGLYHSVVVLVAQKALSRGRLAEAALAFGLIQSGGWSNPYRLQSDDWFWSSGFPNNNPINLLFDALLTDDDLVEWKSLLRSSDRGPLTKRLIANPFFTDRDLTWWQAHRALRRGDGPEAVRLFTSLGGDGNVGSAVFPRRAFAYSVDLDPLAPAGGEGMRTVSPLALARAMAQVESAAHSGDPDALLAQGEFWLSLQLSGLPLLFAQPPTVISFVNGNLEYYGYDGRDLERSADVVTAYPLGPGDRSEDWVDRLDQFYRGEFSTLGRARSAFEAVLEAGADADTEYRALLFLQALDGDRGDHLIDERYEGLPLADEFLSTCEAFW